jgi:hypothetical protein
MCCCLNTIAPYTYVRVCVCRAIASGGLDQHCQACNGCQACPAGGCTSWWLLCFHFGLSSLSISRARTPSAKSPSPAVKWPHSRQSCSNTCTNAPQPSQTHHMPGPFIIHSTKQPGLQEDSNGAWPQNWYMHGTQPLLHRAAMNPAVV